jgi:deoxycitidine kinase/deoxyguanosine kinase
LFTWLRNRALEKRIENLTIVYIDGNIGVGKTSLLDLLTPLLGAIKVKEPVDKWREVVDSKGQNILQHLYANPAKTAGIFQFNAFITRMDELMQAVNKSLRGKGQCLVSERSVQSDAVIFAQNSFDNGTMTEMELLIYQSIHRRWIKLFPVVPRREIYIYLCAYPKTCLARIKKRGRPEEANMTLEYLQQLHVRYERWMSNNGAIVISAEREDFNNAEFLRDLVTQIRNRMKKL